MSKSWDGIEEGTIATDHSPVKKRRGGANLKRSYEMLQKNLLEIPLFLVLSQSFLPLKLSVSHATRIDRSTSVLDDCCTVGNGRLNATPRLG